MKQDASNSATAVKDPVCGMSVTPATAKDHLDHAGTSYYFCCAGCAAKFKADPEKYLAQPPRPPSSNLITLGAARPDAAQSTSSSANQSANRPPTNQPNYVCPMCPQVRSSKPGPCPSCGMALEPETPLAATRTEYTCPMHPEIIRPGPGSCPICGMALEPRTVTAIEEENPELRDMTRRFWVSLALTVPLLALGMMEMVVMFGGLGVPSTSTSATGLAPWIELVLATPIVL